MGAGIIVEKNIANGCESIWQKAPSVPELPINLERYNKGFISFVSLVGAYALIKGSVWATKQVLHHSRPKPIIPTKEKMQTRYGSHSWALIVDCKENEEYCILLAKRGFKLILCGEEDDIKIAEDRVFRETGNLDFKIEPIIVDWEKEAKNLEFYKQLEDTLKDHDISIIVMPKIRKEKTSPTSEEQSPVFEHVYLITRFFGPKLKWRPTSSAIIIPSNENVDKVDESLNGVTRAVQSGVDAFGRTMQYELKGEIDIVIARGSAENALASLGKEKISH